MFKSRSLNILFSVVVASVILVSGCMLEKKLGEYRKELDIKTERVLTMRKGRSVDFAKLKAQSDDVKGWVWLPDSNIDYPIVQGEDNDFYLHHDINGDYLFDGSIFIDSAVAEPFRDFHTIIYGHRMRSGAMLHDIGKFRDREYFDRHNVIVIETEDRSYDLHVVAFCTELADSELYTTMFGDPELLEDWYGDSYYMEDDSDYYVPMTRTAFVELIKDRAVNLSDEPFDENDTFVTLSTCAFATGDQRNQVIGVLKPAALEEKTVEVKMRKPPLNKWLALQMLTGLLMACLIAMLILPAGEREMRENGEEKPKHQKTS